MQWARTFQNVFKFVCMETSNKLLHPTEAYHIFKFLESSIDLLIPRRCHAIVEILFHKGCEAFKWDSHQKNRFQY